MPNLRFLYIVGGSPPQPVVPAHKDKSGAPPVRSIYDDISSPGLGSTPLTSRRQVISIPSSYFCDSTKEVNTLFGWGYSDELLLGLILGVALKNMHGLGSPGFLNTKLMINQLSYLLSLT